MSLFHLDRPALHALNESEAEKTPSQFESKNRADLRRFELLSEFFSHPPTHERIQLLESSGINLKTMTLKQLVTHFVGYKTDYYNLANFRASFFSTWSACGDPRACDNCHQVSCPYGSSVLTAGSNTTQKKRPRVSSFELPDQPPRSSSTNSPLLDSLEELNHYDPTEHATLSQPQTSGFSTSLEASERSYSWPSCQHPTGLEATADNMTLIRAFEGCGRPDLHIKLWFQQCLTISKLKNTPVNKVRKDFDESAAQPLEGTMTPLSFDLPDESCTSSPRPGWGTPVFAERPLMERIEAIIAELAQLTDELAEDPDPCLGPKAALTVFENMAKAYKDHQHRALQSYLSGNPAFKD